MFDMYKLKTKPNTLYYISTRASASAPNLYYQDNNEEITYPEVQGSSSDTYNNDIVIMGNGNTIYINNIKSNNTYFIGKIVNSYENLEKYFHEFTDYETVENNYISFNGNIIQLNNFNYYKFTPKKGKIYLINSISRDEAPLVYGNNNYTIPEINKGINNLYCGKYLYFPNSDLDDIYVNFKTNDAYSEFSIMESNFTLNFAEKSENVNNYNFTNGCCKNLICIGDSLTQGVTYIADNESYDNFFNYPYYLQKIMNIDNLTKIARAGYTATQWWNRYNEQITNENSLYVVWFGTNSEININTVATDCSGEDYNNFAETEVGYFGKILGKISSLPNNKILLLNVFGTKGNLEVTNEVIQDLATKFNCEIIDIQNTNYNNREYHIAYNGYYNGIHFNNVGYNFIANEINKQLNNKLIENPTLLPFYIEGTPSS